MRYIGVITALLMSASSAFSSISDEQHCEKQADVAEKAADLRISGVDRDEATNSLLKMYDHPDSGVTASNIRGMVMVSYMAKMEPKKMRDYTLAECKKDILK